MKIAEWLSQMTIDEKASLCSGQNFWETQQVDRVGIPAVMMCDGPHGLRKQVVEGDHLGVNAALETVCYPTASALACSFDRALLTKLGETLGDECQAENIAMLLGPGVNMKRSPLCGRNFEYFSEDPYLAGQIAAALIRGLQSKGVSCCVKHFAANNQETRRLTGNSEMDERTLREIYLPAFEAAVKEGGARAIMCAYNALNGIYCSEHKKLLTDILREEWGFDGMVVTDWGAVKDRVTGIEAGLDLEMPGTPGVQDAKVAEAVRSGKLSEAKLDESISRVLQLVQTWQEEHRPETEIDRTEMAALSGDIAAQCAVLLKNEGLLPLSRTDKILFLGEFAKDVRYQGRGSSHVNTVNVISATDAAPEIPFVQGYLGMETDPALLAEAVEAAKAASAVVIFAGQPDSLETEGRDRATMELPASQNELIQAVAKVQPNTVVVLHGGSPMVFPWADDVKAILQMYLAGERAGMAAVRLLFGEANPSGKLAESWPLRIEDTPAYLIYPSKSNTAIYQEGVFMGYRYYDSRKAAVAYPFGHGLSYTTFAYSDLSFDKTEMTDDAVLTVTCKVKNTGKVPGAEVVQVYVRPADCDVDRPVHELKGFEKVFLQPGEEKAVSVVLTPRAFAYYEERLGDWFVPAGTYVIEVGSSSRDIRLEDSIPYQTERFIPMVYTTNSTLRDLTKTPNGKVVLEEVKQMGIAAFDNELLMDILYWDMPICSYLSLGKMTPEWVEEKLQQLNP